MKGIYRLLILVSVSVLFFQCQKELSSIANGPTDLSKPDPITATVQGNVLDENNQPVANAAVKTGTLVAQTDSKGYFRINRASLDKNASLVTVEKDGYFKAYRTFNATSGTNQVVIKLVPKELAGTVDAASGGSVSLTNGTKISLPANGMVIKSSGAAFTGTVRVYASYIDPTSADISKTVPGSFMANDKNNKRVVLSSYGMMAVELESSNGTKLQLKSGTTATLNAPIPASILSSAPPTIAMWYVDEQSGIWKEEGSAIKQGNNYVGEVKHFSFWNYDIAGAAINLSLTLKNNEAQPLVHVLVRIKRTNGQNGQAYGYTDSLGQVSGLVPGNENLVLDVLDLCNNSIYTQNIGPYLQNTNLGVITVNASGNSLITLKGRLLNCSSTAVTNGYALVVYDNMVRHAAVNANGDFTTTFVICSGSPGSANIIGVDNAVQQQGNQVSVALASPVTQAGNISACGTSAAQFINFTLDGTNHSISFNPGDSTGAYTYQQGTTTLATKVIGFNQPSTRMYFTFEHPSAVTGSYPITELSVMNYQVGVVLVQPFNVTVTNFPTAIGDFYIGNFTGQFRDDQNQLHNITTSFKLRKEF